MKESEEKGGKKNKKRSKGKYQEYHTDVGTCITRNLQKKKVISVILVNGFRMKGILKEYDRYAIWIESDNQSQLVYEHAISTIHL